MASLKDCEIALVENEDRLASMPNVVGLGITEVEVQDSKPASLAVAVYVEKLVPRKELPKNGVIPRSLIVSRKNSESIVPVRVIEQGPVELEQSEGMGNSIGKEPL